MVIKDESQTPFYCKKKKITSKKNLIYNFQLSDDKQY